MEMAKSDPAKLRMDVMFGCYPVASPASKDEEYAVDVRLLDERKYGGDPSFIEVTVQSPCYRAK